MFLQLYLIGDRWHFQRIMIFIWLFLFRQLLQFIQRASCLPPLTTFIQDKLIAWHRQIQPRILWRNLPNDEMDGVHPACLLFGLLSRQIRPDRAVYGRHRRQFASSL